MWRFFIYIKGDVALSVYVIDAFTETKFGGHPAGVVIHVNLDEEFMLITF